MFRFMPGLFIALVVFAFACSPSQKIANTQQDKIPVLRFLDEHRIAHKQLFNGTTIGGLSGIDFNADKNEYYLVCDDRSAINPARFYTATIHLNNDGIDTVVFTNVTSLLQPNGSTYPNSQQDPFQTPDPEAMRYNKVTKSLIWSSEGERIVTPQKVVLADPFLHSIGVNGTFMDSFALPAQLRMNAEQKGPRQNGVLESLTFSTDHTSMFVAVEEPLLQDGPRAGITDNNALVRFIRFDIASKKAGAQYAYKLDPVAYPPQPAGAFSVNGIPDLLYLDDNRLLVIERSFSTGRAACTVKVFLAYLDGATDIATTNSLQEHPPAILARKQLLLNMDSLNRYIDNIEGVTFGPTLPNGHRTLLFVSDDNFSTAEVTQFLLFELVP